MKNWIVLFFLLLFFAPSVPAKNGQAIRPSLNSWIDQWREKISPNNASTCLKQCDVHLKKQKKIFSILEKSYIWGLKGTAYTKLKQFKNALKSHQKALFFRQKNIKEYPELTVKSYKNIGNTYFTSKNYEKARVAYEQALSILNNYCSISDSTKKTLQEELQDYLGHTQCQIAYKLLTSEQVEDNFNRVATAKLLLDSAAIVLIHPYPYLALNTAIYYWKTHNYTESQKQIDLGKKQINAKDKEVYAEFLLQEGLTKRYANQPRVALDTLLKAMSILKKLDMETANTFICYQQIGGIYEDIAQFDTAIRYYAQAANGLQGESQKKCQLNLLECALKTNKTKGLEQKLKAYLKNEMSIPILYTVHYLLGNYYFKTQQLEKALQIYQKNLSKNGTDSYQKIQLLVAISEIWQQKATQQSQEIQQKKAWQHVDALSQQALDLLRSKNNELHDEYSSINLEQEIHRLFDLGIAASLALGQTEEAFKRVELSKNNLYKQLNKDSLYTNLASVTTLQQDLSDEQTLLEYYFKKDTSYLFIFKKYSFEVKKLALKPTFLNEIHDFLQACHRKPLRTDHIDTYQPLPALGYSLYNQLLEPLQECLTSQLIIVPDADLGYLPFDALLYQPHANTLDAFKTYPFLVRKYTISYSNSATLFHYFIEKKETKYPQQCLAVAPDFMNTNHPLYHNQEEVAQINQFIPTTILGSTEASKSKFLREAPAYPILHLATHSVVNEGNYALSSVAFSETETDNLLLADEIEQQQLNATLLVLSACQTANGQLYRGEGVLNLARSFQHAGVRSVFAALWNVDDMQTSILMRYFYEQLCKGYNKAESSKKAKCTFIEKVTNDEAHPYFWAEFVLIGENSALKIAWITKIKMFFLTVF